MAKTTTPNRGVSRTSREEVARQRFSQSEFPSTTLQEAQRIAAGLVDNFGGRPATPPDVAMAIEISPTSSSWRLLSRSSIGYGLTEGGPNADAIALTALGRRLVAPEQEGDDIAARHEAILRPRIMREFFERYRRAKFPNDTVAVNVLRSLGLPGEGDRLGSALEIVRANGRYAGVIRQLPTGLFVNLDSPGVPPPATTNANAAATDEDVTTASNGESATAVEHVSKPTATAAVASNNHSNRVFISHGKQKEIVTQLKELLTFGQFEPVLSVERESTAIPVPEKVFEDMRSCAAGVIHVGGEGEYLDRDGNKQQKINDNVLIEIGAAMALYGKRVILLVEKDLSLPSNLQGLYRCDFVGGSLDHTATMKLLKTFSQFR